MIRAALFVTALAVGVFAAGLSSRAETCCDEAGRAKCTGAKSCKVCKDCSRCAHCKKGGSCGVCS